MNVLLQKSVDNLDLIISHFDYLKNISSFDNEKLIFSFYLTKELLLSKSSALTCLIDDYQYLISKKILLHDVIEEIIIYNDLQKTKFSLIDNELETNFKSFKSIVSPTADTSTIHNVLFILDNFNKAKGSRQAMRYGINFLACYLKHNVTHQFKYLQYYSTQSTPKLRYNKQRVINKMEVSFYPSSKLNTPSITFFCMQLNAKNFTSEEQNFDFERAMLGYKIEHKIIWQKDISTLFYFIQQMHKNKYLIDHSAYKWKATANIFSLDDQEIDFKKLRGLKKTKYCVVIDELFNSLKEL